MAADIRPAHTWERYAWFAGLVFVVAVVLETAISATLPINQNDSAAKIAREIDAHSTTVLVVMCICVVYAVAFPIYLWKLHDRLREDDPPRALAALILVGGALMILLHATSDVGVYGMLGAKLASYSAHHDPGISYTLYLMTSPASCCSCSSSPRAAPSRSGAMARAMPRPVSEIDQRRRSTT